MSELKHIEFFGLPGAGKTTFCKKLLEKKLDREEALYFGESRRQVYEDLNINKKWYLFRLAVEYIKILLFHPVFCMRTVLLPRLKPNNLAAFRFTLSAVLVYAIVSLRFSLARQNNYQFLLQDQGTLQSWWSTWRRGKINKQRLEELIKNGKQFYGDYVIHLDVSPETAARREKAEDEERLAEELHSHQQKLSEILSLLEKNSSVEVLKLDAELPVGENIEELMGFIR